MARLFSQSKPGWVLLLAAAAVAAGAPYLDSYFQHVLFMILLYAYCGVAWNIISGMGGQLSLGHALYLGAGAYTAVMLYTKAGLSPWIGMWIGGLLAAALAGLIGAITFRAGLLHDYYTLSTIAIAQAGLVTVANIRQLGGSSGLALPYVASSWWQLQLKGKLGYVYVILVFLVVLAWLVRRLEAGAMGLKLRAIRENEALADSAGIDIYQEKIRAYMVSAFAMAVGGAIFAFYLKFIDPHLVLSMETSLRIAMFAIVGGIGTAFGPIWGALFLVPVDELTRTFAGSQLIGLGPLIYGLILTIVILRVPQGLNGVGQGLRRYLAARRKEGGGRGTDSVGP